MKIIGKSNAFLFSWFLCVSKEHPSHVGAPGVFEGSGATGGLPAGPRAGSAYGRLNMQVAVLKPGLGPKGAVQRTNRNQLHVVLQGFTRSD